MIPHDERIAVDIRPARPETWAELKHCRPGHELVYRFYTRTGVLLYIGITWSAKARWEKHRKTKSWWNRVARVELQCFDHERAALAAELAAIKAERPLFNLRGAVAA